MHSANESAENSEMKVEEPLTRRTFVLKSLAAASALAAAPAGLKALNASGSRPPNIVFILADDMGVNDSSIYGQRKFSTPNVDRLAADGLRFTDAYAGAPICSPSRCTLLTGLHTGHSRIRGNMALAGGIVGNKGKEIVRRANLLPEDKTVANYLHDAGYYTGLMGKWHLDGYDPGATPVDHGFDEFKGWLIQDGASQGYFPTERIHNKKVIHFPENEEGRRGLYETEVCIADSCEFIRSNAEKPFFLYLGFNNPHSPYVSPTVAAFAGKTWTYDEKIYASMIAFLDDGVGQVMQTIKDAGLDDNTIVFFASDNGPRSEPTVQQTTVVNFFDSNGIFRGYKRELYEGGIREPFIVRWPGHIRSGTTTNVPIYFPDFLPTALALAGAPEPSGGDGIDITPVILHNRKPEERFLYWETFEPAFWQAARYGKWKAVRPRLGALLEIYDLSEDPSEKKDIASANPAIVAEFERFLRNARTESVNWPVDKQVAANDRVTNE